MLPLTPKGEQEWYAKIVNTAPKSPKGDFKSGMRDVSINKERLQPPLGGWGRLNRRK